MLVFRECYLTNKRTVQFTDGCPYIHFYMAIWTFLFNWCFFIEPDICNKTMVNLIPTFSLQELKELKLGAHSKKCKHFALEKGEEAIEDNFDKQDPVLLKRDSIMAEYLPLFSDVLASVPTKLAFDVELKYPQDTPCMAFKLEHEFGINRDVLADFGYPSRYFYSINRFADNVIRVRLDRLKTTG